MMIHGPLVQRFDSLLFLLALPAAAQTQTCIECHAEVHRQWARSAHAKMMRPATERGVEGDFTKPSVVLRGSRYLLRHRNGLYSIGEVGAGGKEQEHRVDYTLGSRRVQQYLSTLGDGRIVILPIAWDNVGKKWIHDLDVHNPEEPANGQTQVWNKSCYSCHVTGGRKNFELDALRYSTKWQDFGVACESCHGPGREHVAKARARSETTLIRAAIVNPARLDALRSSMVCAQCHSLRDVYADGFKAGADYYDYFLPVMQYRLPASDDSAYWPDGRTRWFANDASGLWQSQCFLKGGATCLTCHSQAHDVASDSAPDSHCARCHAAVARNIPAHTRHAANSRGSSCVECHMPPSVAGISPRIRDHLISVPVPENTIRYGIPNACNLCHQDRDAEWALTALKKWGGGTRRETLIRRADAFARAQKGDPQAVPALLRVLADASEGAVVRANAAGFLGNFPEEPAAYDAVVKSFSDPEPLVRATAVLALRPRAAQREAAAPLLVSLLKDDIATVRVNAAIALVAMGVRRLPGEDGDRFKRAKALYRARADLESDDAAQQFAAGRFSLLSGDNDIAAARFRAAMKLDPALPAQYYLGVALAQKGDLLPARDILTAIRRSDPQYAAAQRALAQIEAQNPRQSGGDGSSLFLDGKVQFQNANYAPALKEFDQALQRAPHAEWAAKAAVLRAICLEKLGRTNEAETAMQALSRGAAAARDVDLQLAFIELLYDTGRPQEALRRADDLIAAVPDAPMARFWRAKALLQLHRTADAASAAEESIHLDPQLAAAHTLLIRIYQMQGRTADAAQQAQWVRDYQKRLESR
jgi:tetratricopeptide (TPR) repeat protein